AGSGDVGLADESALGAGVVLVPAVSGLVAPLSTGGGTPRNEAAQQPHEAGHAVRFRRYQEREHLQAADIDRRASADRVGDDTGYRWDGECGAILILQC